MKDAKDNLNLATMCNIDCYWQTVWGFPPPPPPPPVDRTLSDQA